MDYSSNPITPKTLALLEGFGHKPFAEQAELIQDLADDYLVRHRDWMRFAQDKDASLKEKYDDESLLREELRTYPGLKALAAHEVAHAFYDKGKAFQPTARAISEAAASLTGADIHPGATIDPYVFIDHAKGVVIGETAIVERGAQIFQGVTLGAVGKSDGAGRRHPHIGKDVVLSADTQIMGSEKVGDRTLIGPSSQVIKTEIGDAVVMKPSTRISDVPQAINDGAVLIPQGQQLFVTQRNQPMDEAQQEALSTYVAPKQMTIEEVTERVMQQL